MKKLILFCATCMALAMASNLSAQLPKRLVVIEEYTSATCTPCLIAEAALKPIVLLSNGVVAVRYHQPIPYKGDPFYTANVAENKGRNDYYAVGSAMPAARLNGHINVDPTDSNKVREAVKLSQSLVWPVWMTVEQDKTDKNNIKVKVTVRSDIALDNYTLQTAVTVHDLKLEKLPLLPPDYTETLEHWNGSKEFPDAMLKMLPDINGTPVTIPAGGTKTFELSYKAEEGDLWNFEQLTAVAFLQNNATSEIIQGATTVTGTIGAYVGTTVSYPPSVAPVFAAKNANEFVETKVVVSNISATPIAYEGFSVTKSTRTPADWTLSVSDPTATFTIEPGTSREVTIRLTRGTSIGSGEVLVNFKESGAGGRAFSGTPITIVAKEAEGFLVIDNPTLRNEPYNSALQARTGGKKYVEISPSNIIRYNSLFPNMKQIIWNCADSGAVDVKEFAFITSMMNQGVSSIISGEFVTNFANFNGGGPMFDMFGASYTGKVIRDQIFKVAGVAGDTISDGINDSCSIKANYAFYTLSMKKPLKAGVTPFLRHASAVNDSVGGIRYEAPTARMIYFSMNPGIIINTAVRNSMINRSLAWIENYVPVAVAKLTALKDTVNFGITSNAIDTAVEFQNTSTVPCEVTDVVISGQDAMNFTLPNGVAGLVIAPKETKKIIVRFTPQPAITSRTYRADMSVIYNNNSSLSVKVHLTGEGMSTGVDEDGTHTTISLGAQPNPATDGITVTYTQEANRTGELMLTDVLGREVRRMTIGVQQAGTYSSVLETSDLPTGAYTLVFTSGNQRSQLPVMIVR
ncbi:MAG: T9SS type A sorting domain-containing protein [Candidatus Kapaibacterium sp.]